MDYLIRLILCSGLLIAIYYGFLEYEKMHRFNRFYLLFAVIVSLFLPALSFESKHVAFEQADTMLTSGTVYITNSIESLDMPVAESISWENILIGIYCIITLILFTRFVVSNLYMLRKAKKSALISLQKATLALTKKHHPPHSYLYYIFIPKLDYENGLVDQEIIDHEIVHITQKHTLDVLFIELILVFTWFNPIFYLYRNVIRLNHEFLADEEVCKKQKNISHYKHLILSQAAHANGLRMNNLISSSFNFLNTKKRLEMITKNRFYRRIILKQCCLIPVVLIAVLLFSKNSISQDVKKAMANEEKEIIPLQAESEKELQTAFDKILESYIVPKGDKYRINLNFSEADEEQIKIIYQKMSASQKSKQRIRIYPRSHMQLKKKTPTREEFEKWKDPQLYGIWLNAQRINNDLLNTYTNTDFSYFSTSKLAKNAKNYGKHIYQLDVRTNEDFESYNTRLLADSTLMIWPNIITQD